MSDVKFIMHATFVTFQTKYKYVADIQMRIFNLCIHFKKSQKSYMKTLYFR